MIARNPPSIVMARSLVERDDNSGAIFGVFFSKEISGYLFLNGFFIIFMLAISISIMSMIIFSCADGVKDEDKRDGGGDGGVGSAACGGGGGCGGGGCGGGGCGGG
ncbi:hypothetical protein AMTRI_Chr10g233130 [Amborella trichopoda]